MIPIDQHFPNVVIIHGAASNAVQPFIHQLPENVLKVLIWNQTPPPNLTNSVAVRADEDLATQLKELNIPNEGRDRIGLVLAAVKSQERLLAVESDESIQEQIASNVLAPVKVIRDVLPAMIRARFGRIVFLSSFRVQAPTRGTSIYSGSKAFGELLIRSVALEYGRFGISASTIRMGFFEGGIMATRQDQLGDTIKGKIAIGRMGSGEELAKALHFAMREPYLSGGFLEFNGGLDLG